jgi:hypothetical protein
MERIRYVFLFIVFGKCHPLAWVFADLGCISWNCCRCQTEAQIIHERSTHAKESQMLKMQLQMAFAVCT